MNHKDFMRLEIPALSRNESLARAVVAAYASRLDPTLEEISDVKTAVSEAVTNSIIHAYEEEPGQVYIFCSINQSCLTVEIADRGKGIGDLAQAREPFYTSKPELERSGMGFTIMESFMDKVEVETEVGEGTTVRMVKYFSPQKVQGEKSCGATD